MDCPMEEALIRKKLATVPGITGLGFNLMQRVLTVEHGLPSTAPIESALRAIGMTPETLDAAGGATAVFVLDGMDCPTEERLVRKALDGLPGLLGLETDLMQRRVHVRHEPAALPAISAALEGLDMGARLLGGTAQAQDAMPAPRIPWKRLAVAGGFAILSELMELVRHWEALPPDHGMASWTVAGWPVLTLLPLLFAIIAILLGGLTTYRKGWLAVSNLDLNINALMSVAVTGAVLIGQFPEAAMVMVLFNVSEAIEARALDRARNAIRDLLALAPATATVLREDGSWQEADIRTVAAGSRVRVRPGEKIALDGLVLDGHSLVDQSPITGESMPVEKQAGDTVYAGTLNTSGSFEFRVTAAATDTTLARIIHAVEEAQGSRAPMQRLVDTFARCYTPAVFVVALLAAVVPPLFLGTAWTDAVYTALVLLVIGCPCALVISTPVSIVSGMAAATRYGILIKGGLFLEQGRRLDCLALDKTGTLTCGTPRQTDCLCTGQEDETEVRSLAASLAARSDHPVSGAIAQAAAKDGIPLRDVDDFTALPGQGVSGVMAGQRWYLGNRSLAASLGRCPAEVGERIARLEQQGKTVVALVGDKGVQALLAVADTPKASSLEAVRELKELGVRTVMLTGDNGHAAAAIARQVGVDDFRADLLPADKLAVIEELEARGHRVGMVGDGINDAPALARADIGFAMAGNGTDTAIETADVALMDDDLRKIPRFIRLSRATFAILVQNIALALGVKALFLALTFTGHATMWMAVFADVGTALLVVANGLRAMRQ
ncbi:heavy metal translocating P-type ATPase [uncultured Desulfovibrio sp.]|uniref:heavy metal translocating P-type ATPase n=1 Tax=uncultured Desulfovibrio sp. TaxID=167968 RepID=UPI0034196A3B